MREIPLWGKGKIVIAKALVDDDDFERLSKHRWFRLSLKSPYAMRKAKKGESGSNRLMHREVIGAIDGKVVDHVNGDGLDNRKANLRLCSVAQNAHNRHSQKNNRSGSVGVYFDKNNPQRKWLAVIGRDGKNITLGYYETFEEALRVRKAAERKMYGEFAPR